MPQKIKRRNAARKARRGPAGRKNNKRPGRTGSTGPASAASAIISNSIFALIIKDKPGVEVVDKVEAKRKRNYFDGLDDYYQMYADLLKCMQNGLKLLKGEETKADVLAGGLGIGLSLVYVISAFENNILPEGFSYSVDRLSNSSGNSDGGEYFFTIYDDCRSEGYWQPFEIKPVVTHLLKTNKRLHDFFLVFMKAFMHHTGVYGWWNGGCHYADDFLEEELEYWEENHGGWTPELETEKQEALETLNNYKTGVAHRYHKKLVSVKPRSVKSLQKSLQHFNKKHPLVKWMKAAAVFMAKPGDVSQFLSREVMDNEFGGEGLEFDQFSAVIWDWDDAYTAKHMEFIDSESQGCGVVPPIVSTALMKSTKKLDFTYLKSIAGWPIEFTQIWEQYYEFTLTIKPPKSERSHANIEVNV